MDVRAVRSAGWSGIAFVVAIAASAALPGSGPAPNADAPIVGAYVSSHHYALLFGAWLVFPASAFFLWFAVGLREYMRALPAGKTGMPTYALLAGVLTVAAALVQAFAQSAMAWMPASAFGPNGMTALYALYCFSLAGLGFAPIAVFAFAAAAALAPHRALVVLGYLTGVACTLATFGIFTTDPVFAPPGGVVALAAIALAVIWTICASVVLIRVRPAT